MASQSGAVDANNLVSSTSHASILVLAKSYQIMNASRKTIRDLPTELLDQILTYLEPIDAYATKLSCRHLMHTRGTPRDCIKAFRDNPWETYLSKVWCEDPNAALLLCTTCRTRHPGSCFVPVCASGITRHCDEFAQDRPGVAIELAQSKLTANEIVRAVSGDPDQATRQESFTAYPNRAYRRGLESGLLLSHVPTHFKSPLHSPYQYPVDADFYIPNDSYEMNQEIRHVGSKAVITSWMQLVAIFMFETDLAANTPHAIDDLRAFYRRLDINGGLWFCPHTSPLSEHLCEQVLSVFRSAVFDPGAPDTYKTFEYSCGICGTKIESSETFVRSGNDPHTLFFDIDFIITKDLGPMDNWYRGDVRSSDFDRHGVLHFSRRIV